MYPALNIKQCRKVWTYTKANSIYVYVCGIIICSVAEKEGVAFSHSKEYFAF